MNTILISKVSIQWMLFCIIVINITKATVLDSGQILVAVGGIINLRCQNKTNGAFESVVWTANAYTQMKESIIAYDINYGERATRPYLNRVKRYDGTSVQITNARIKDTGNYECNIIFFYTPNDDEPRRRVSLLAIYDVVVVDPPVITNIQSEKILIANGETGNVYCDVRGLSSFNVSWVKENDALRSNVKVEEWIKTDNGVYKIRSRLIFEKFNEDNEGIYKCVAHNFAEKVWKGVSVLMKKKPSMTAETTMIAIPGQTISIWCNATGTPTINVTWTLMDKDEVLKENERLEKFEVAPTEYEGNVVSSKLIIRQVQKEDWGGYRCTANNDVGYDEKEIILTGFTEPVAPSIISATQSENYIHLYWDLGHNGGRSIQSIIIEYKESREQHWSKLETRGVLSSYEVMNLKSGTYYDFRIQSVNKIGRSDYSKTYSIQTKLKKPNSSESEEKRIRILGLDLVPFTGIVGGLFLIMTCIIVCLCLMRQNRKLKQKSRKNRDSTEKEKLERKTKTTEDQEMQALNHYS